MRRNPEFSANFRKIELDPGKPPSLMQKIVGAVVTVAIFGVALMFSVAFFAVILTVGAVVGGYFWWKTRAIRKQMREDIARMREAQARQNSGDAKREGLVIEGEVIREVPPEQKP